MIRQVISKTDIRLCDSAGRPQTAGVMEYRSDGVLEKNEGTAASFITNTPILQYSNTPSLRN